MTYEEIMAVSQEFKTTPVKGKDYVQVNERVKAFRKLMPEGSIVTDIVSMDKETVCVKASVIAYDGRLLATGFASEDKAASMINKTSYIENCETSAVGRALGFLGIGIDASICSAEELEHAIESQKAIEDKEKGKKAEPKKSEPKKEEPKTPEEIKKAVEINEEDSVIDAAKLKVLKATMERKGVTNEMVISRVKGLKNLKDLKVTQFMSIMRMLEKTPDKPQDDLGF